MPVSGSNMQGRTPACGSAVLFGGSQETLTRNEEHTHTLNMVVANDLGNGHVGK